MSRAAEQAREASSQANAVAERTIVLQLSVNTLGNRGMVESEAVDVNADKTMIHVSKDLLRSPELRKVRRIEGRCRRAIKGRSFPAIFKGGFYQILLEDVEELDEAVSAYETEWWAAVRAFIKVYGSRVREARERLRPRSDVARGLAGTFDPAEYPGVVCDEAGEVIAIDNDAVMAEFSWEWRYVSFGTPGSLKSIRRALFEREKEKAARAVEGVAENMKAIMRAKLHELVTHMADLLRDTEDGKRKIIRQAATRNLAAFLERWPSVQNVVDDAEASRFAEQAAGILNGMDLDAIKDDDSLRRSVQANFEALKDALDPLVTDAPIRRMQLDE